MQNYPPVSGVARAPFEPIRSSDMQIVPVGVPIDELPRPGGMVVCRVNGEWLARESWRSETRVNDVIEWHPIPEDKDALRAILSIAAIIFIPQLGLGSVGTFFAATAAQLAINALLPPTVPELQRGPSQTADNFSTSLQGNIARLDQPIWKICGRREITPPFACQPYLDFRPRVGEEDENLDNEQFFSAVYAVGIGNYEVLAAKLANTPITRFSDVLVAQYLAPGVQPSQVEANVTTATEVSGQVLESGLYVGGFAACAARRTCRSIGIDVSATQGLGKTGALSVEWNVEYREINDFGQVLTEWTILASEEREAFTATPQRWSSRYELPTPARVEIRLLRTDTQDTSPQARHEIAWIGLRAYLDEPAPLNPNASHFEVVLRASSQLSNLSSKDLRLIVDGLVRTWDTNTDTPGWTPEVASRNGAWWALDLALSSTWGMGKPESRVDMESFIELAATAEARQDRFDYVFDSTMNAWDALQLIARTMRARVFRRQGKISIARDELAEIPVTAFSSRNCQPGITIREKARDRRSPDGVIVEYEDHRTGEWTEIDCPLPGASTTEMLRPVFKRLPGIIGRTHAEREGRYEAACLLWRNRQATWSTEMQGILPAYLSPVLVQPDIPGYGQTGDVVGWNEGTLTMTLSEPPNFVTDELVLTLVRDDGSLFDVLVTVGDGPTDVVLNDEPDFEIVLDDGTRERPKYLLGPVVGSAEVCKVSSIAPGALIDGARILNLAGVVDDPRVHAADEDLLPSSSGEIQDPLGLPDDEGGGGVAYIVRIVNHTITGVYLSGVGSPIGTFAQYELDDEGFAKFATQDGGGGGLSGTYSQEWLQFGTPVSPSEVSALYEVRASILSESFGSDDTLTGALDTWVPFGETWRLTRGVAAEIFVVLKIEIRKVAEPAVILDTANIRLENI